MSPSSEGLPSHLNGLPVYRHQGACSVRNLEGILNGGIETAMVCKGLPIGVSNGLAKNRRFWRGFFPRLGVRGARPSSGGD